jgi:hypothetical protein
VSFDWVKPGTKVQIRQIEDQAGVRYNQRLKGRKRPTPVHVWRIEDLDSNPLNLGLCTTRLSAVDLAHDHRLSVMNDSEEGAA